MKSVGLAAGIVLSGTVHSLAGQFGLVVGIDDYIYLKPPIEARAAGDPIGDLLGAENDATEIAAALLSRGIDLPQSRVLLSRDATLENFLDAWNQMTAQAKPGDTLVVSFAGHGGQETEVAEPRDESDGRDETIMFADFNPDSPRQGRLNDDQLRKLLSDAAQFNIVWVMDSCHSGGLERSINAEMTGLSRNGGNWDIAVEPLVSEIEAGAGDGDATLAHVTQILATATDDRVVTETSFGGKPHGALSYFFASAVRGAADSDNDSFVSRRELSAYLDTQIVAHMNQNQQPRILPRGDSTIALALGEAARPEPPVVPLSQKIRVRVIGGQNPFNFGPRVQIVEIAADVTFQTAGDGWLVFNHTGDKIASLPASRVDDASKIIAGLELLAALPEMLRSDLPLAKILPDQSAELQRIGTRVGFRFVPPAPDMNFLTIFNLAGDGTFQYLHPAPSDRPYIAADGLPIQFQVTPPTGADQLVGLYCRTDPADFQNFLRQHDQGYAPEPAAFKTGLAAAECQIARIGLFTTD